jgi:hypothetical protein
MIVEARFALIVDTKGGRLALEAPRFTDAEACAHEETKIEPGDVNEQTLGDVLVMAQIDPPHATGLESVGEGPLNDLPATTHQMASAQAVFSAPIGIDGVAFRSLAVPLLSTATRFGDVAAPHGCTCPPLNVAVLGKPGKWGANPNGDPDTALQDWLNSSSAGTARVDNFTNRVTLTSDFLATYNVIILASLSDDSNLGPFWTFDPSEVAAFQDVLVYGDEWITYTTQWNGVGNPETNDPACAGFLPQDVYQTAQFWYNMIKWSQPSAACFEIVDEQQPVVIW